MIACTSIYGNRKLVPREKLVFRPAAYAIVVDDGKVLLGDDRVEDGEAKRPRWVGLDNLKAGEFQSCGEEILQLAREAAG